MSPRKSDSAKTTVAPRPDVYVALLAVSLAALIGGCIFLWTEMGKYDWMIAR